MSMKGMFASLVTATICLLAPVNAQNPPARTYQPGPWQPVARFANPKQTLRVVLINQSGIPLQYGLSSGDALNAVIPVKGKATVTTNVIPDYILVYPNKAENVDLNFQVTANGNTATVTITQTNEPPGYSTVNLHETGAIYIY
ncbi:hypothetical protein [Calothrix sp. 336/3]|uniref:hypothetical protein n=1 Tax=Calothrix sp. 336/3 TaxID=1337936 RepID=UPI0004E33E5A|nr:hypothetical protein [Calothrix sp. 336/3]AKG22811.1 hypothetical protein IJ00_17385 [Calothrix sp. 336/3]